MGRPQIGRSGLRGNRVDSSRAGITPRTLIDDLVVAITIPPCRKRRVAGWRRLYRGWSRLPT
ncbi:MAG: hypothetical protein PHD43_24360 [Methylococcales bacterium]|nr:hypothetical protein [Methylococcales bacterium]